MSRVPFLAKCERAMALYRRSSTSDVKRSRSGYATWAHAGEPSSRLVVLMADVELQRRTA